MPVSPLAPSEILRTSFASRTLGRDWDYVVYLPPGYSSADARLPVVYLLHGACGAAADYVEQGDLQAIADRMIHSGAIERAVLVTPNGFESWYVDHPPLTMQEAFLGEFIPHIESTFRFASSRESRRIGGLSMGGFGALRFALLRPDLFSRAALISPAVYATEPADGSSARTDPPFCNSEGFDRQKWTSHNYPALIDAYLARNCPLPFFISSGDSDRFGIHDEALTLYRFLRERGQDGEFHLVPGDHDWLTWMRLLDPALRFLLRSDAISIA